VLLGVNTFFVQYEQEVRPYALALLGSVLATLLFVRAVQQPSLRRWLAYGAGSAFAFYAHPYFALVMLAHLLSLPLRRVRPRLDYVLAGYGLSAAMIAPLARLIAATDSLSRSFLQKPTLRSLELFFLEFVGGRGPSPLGKTLLLFYFVACSGALVIGGRALLRRRTDLTDERTWQIGLILLWLLVPVVVVVGVSMVHPAFYPRYLIVALPALVTLAAIGIAALRGRVLPTAALATAVALTAPQLASFYSQKFNWGGEDPRAAANYMFRERQAGDGVIFAPWQGRISLDYYLRRLNAADELVPVYPDIPWGEYVPVLSGDEGDNQRGSSVNRTVRHTAAQAGRLPEFRRVWVILLWAGFAEPIDNTHALQRALAGWALTGPCRQFGPLLRVCLYVNPAR
jgi:mannosyltransferase